ncbi:MAG: insulinase family protein [Eubacteriales bacterium]|nr:insulinase family protein [Eubacteriales bacterium]
MKEEQNLHGFKVKRKREIVEMKAVLYELQHEKSDAGLIWLDRAEQNKTFCVSFKTIPEDDTGVFHILEHAVLGGSKKYKVKEPFAELLKSSVNTFLNAMTFNDKTMYPIASRNESDFFNLMDVYLDAVFQPRVLEDPNIFYQEGWHYSFDENEEPSYQGVVFNEMKGAASTLNRKAHSELDQLLFPDSCYRFDSGGNPEQIVDLTYDDFKKAHARYYHPSNAHFFLDGDLPIERLLEKLNNDYLRHYVKEERGFDIGFQKPRPGKARHYYEIGVDEDAEDKCRLTLAAIVCSWEDIEKQYAVKILCDALAESNESPLKKTILDKGLAQDFEMYLSDGIAQPWIGLEAQNTSEEKFSEIKDTVFSTLTEIADRGINKADLLASLNQLYFQELDPDEPRGVYLAISAMDSWLYGGDPALYFSPGVHFDALRKKIDSDYFEELLREVFLDNTNLVELHSLPSHTYGAERDGREAERLAQESELWSESERLELIESEIELNNWQEAPDSDEALATVPRLTLEDLLEEPEYLEINPLEIEGLTVLTYPSPTEGIVYLKLYFDISDTPHEDLSQLNFMSELMGKLGTTKRNAEEIQREVKTHIGSLDFSLMPVSDYENPERCKLFYVISCSVLENELLYAVDLIREIVKETVFDDAQRAYAYLLQIREMLRQATNSSAHAFGIMRVKGHYSAAGAAVEVTSGFSFILWLKEFISGFDTKWSQFLNWADTFQRQMFGSERLTVSVSGYAPEVAAEKIALAFPSGSAPLAGYAEYSVSYPAREGVVIPSAVSYACMACDTRPAGGRYSGEWLAVNRILTLEYLWNKIRVQGGAYGCGFSIDKAANCFFHSYRDPQPWNSLTTYRNSALFLQDFAESENDIDRFIIGTISGLDPQLSHKRQVDTAELWYFSGYSAEKTLHSRRELMATDTEDLLKLSQILAESVQENSICLVGPADVVKDKDLSLIDIS